MPEPNLPKALYHGSLYKQNELMPGFKRSGKLVQWDGMESNQFLYTTTEKEEAINLGFGSAVEKTLNTRRYTVLDNNLVLYFAKELPDVEKVYNQTFYVYTIEPRPEHCWVKNNNPFNQIDTEWITKNTIEHIVKCEQVDVKKWLADKKLYLTTAAIDCCPKQLIDGTRWHDKSVIIANT